MRSNWEAVQRRHEKSGINLSLQPSSCCLTRRVAAPKQGKNSIPRLKTRELLSDDHLVGRSPVNEYGPIGRA